MASACEGPRPAQLAGEPPQRVPLALPLDSAPRLSQDHLRRLWPPPASQGLALVPLSGWTVSPALRSSGAALTAGGHRIGFGTCRSSVGLWSFPWTLVTTSPHSFGHIPPTLHVWGWLRGAARRQAERVTGSGWLELEGARQGLAQEPSVPFTQALWSGHILTGRKCLFASLWGQ